MERSPLPAEGDVRVRFFGILRALRKEQGLEPYGEMHVSIPPMPASELARRLGLPLDRIEGVFCNHRIHPLSHVIRPGDEIAFVPKGTPGPHRYFLGLYQAGQEGSHPSE